MDSLRPKLVTVDKRNYRFPDNSAWTQYRNVSGNYEEDQSEPIYDSEEECDESNIEIVAHSGGRFMHTFHVPRYFIKRLYIKSFLYNILQNNNY